MFETGHSPVAQRKVLTVSQSVNQGHKIEYMLKISGPKPITVAWFLNDAKLKSSKNRKVTYSSTSGEAKLLVMEAEAEDMGEYRVEISNAGGQVTQTAMVTVICKYDNLSFTTNGTRRKKKITTKS